MRRHQNTLTPARVGVEAQNESKGDARNRSCQRRNHGDLLHGLLIGSLQSGVPDLALRHREYETIDRDNRSDLRPPLVNESRPAFTYRVRPAFSRPVTAYRSLCRIVIILPARRVPKFRKRSSSYAP